MAKVAEANTGGMVCSNHILKHADSIDKFGSDVAGLVVQNIDTLFLELVI